MATVKATPTQAPVITNDSDVVLRKAKGFWDQYSKPVIYVGGAIILLIGGWYVYQNFIKLPKERSANDMLFPAEGIFDKMASSSFSADSVNVVLNGGSLEGRKINGLLKVISSYDGTKAANRAKYMAGATYLQSKQFDKAIKYLKDFDANGATQVEMMADKMLGDAYSELKKTDDALNYYKKSAEVNEKDEAFTANALLLAASYAHATGNNKEAIELYKKLKDKYPGNTSVSNGEVAKQLASLGDVGDN